jgi:hypothetical protein
MENHVKLQLNSNIFHKKCLNFQDEFSLWSFIMTSNMPLYLTHILKNNFFISIIMVMVLISLNLANLENLSTTTKMASFLCQSERHVMSPLKHPCMDLLD